MLRALPSVDEVAVALKGKLLGLRKVYMSVEGNMCGAQDRGGSGGDGCIWQAPKLMSEHMKE